MYVAGCQLDIAWEDKPANFDRVRQLLDRAAPPPGSLVALPEMFATGFSMHVDAIAEPADGPTHQFLAEQARSRQIALVGGVVTRAADGRGRNEAVVFSPQGQELARYCKMQPFSFAGETKYYQSGEGTTLFDWSGCRAALFVCYDLRFPELFRVAVRSGAELLVVVANWPQPRAPHWHALLAARAIENQCFVLGVNRTLSDPHVAYAGGSQIVGPRGELLALAADEATVVAAELDLAALRDYRRVFPALADIRPELFGR